MADFLLKRGDTAHPISVTLSGVNGETVNLAGASVRFHMSSARSTAVKVNAPAIIINEAEGIVRYDWQPEDVDTSGMFFAEWEVTFAGGKKQTYPNHDEIRVPIRDDLA